VPQQPYDPAVRAQVKSIGILTPALADELAVRMMVHPGASFGLIGAAIAEADMSSKSDDFTEAVRSKGFQHRAHFVSNLAAALQGAGYQVREIGNPRASDEFKFFEQYPASDGSVDTYLDIYSGLIGYTAAGAATPYRPTMYMAVRLVDAKEHKTLYQDVIVYNAFGNPKDAITISPTTEFDFKAFDDLMAGQDRAIDGLKIALKTTGDEIGRQLR
jgi:hypothetical protein